MNKSTNTEIKLGAKDLRVKEPTDEELNLIKKQEIYIVLDNILDTYNIGSIFRLADAVAAKKIYLCKGSVTPPNHRIQKSSVGTWQWVDWEYYDETTEAIKNLKLKIKNLRVIGVEIDSRAIDYKKADYTLPIALIVGHESTGISKDVLDMCDEIVQLPMMGVNKSLNTMVSLGISLYEVLRKNEKN